MKKAILLLGLAFLIILFSGCINPPICGNGICEQGETPENCSINTGGDCPSIDLCGNGVCDTSLGETAENCPQDCGTQEANVELIDLSPTFFKANKDLRFEATVYFSKGTDNSKFSSEAKFVLVDSLGNKMEIPAEFTWNADGTGKLAGGTSKIDLAFGNTNLTAVLAFNGKEFYSSKNSFRLLDASSFQCIPAQENLSAGNKINIVVLASSYGANDLTTFESEAKKDLGLTNHEWYIGLLNLKPFSKNKDKFNIYLLENTERIYVDDGQGIMESDFNDVAKAFCMIKPDVIVVLSHEGGGSAGGKVAIVNDYNKTNDDCILEGYSWTCSDPNGPHNLSSVFIHEFGHAFADLGDEYLVGSYNSSNLQLKQNQDVEFCPKWCSGKPNNTEPCYQDYSALVSCLKEKSSDKGYATPEEISKCVEGKNSDEILNCNVGENCVAGAGCYIGANSFSAYKAIINGVMSTYSYLGQVTYGPVNELIIQKIITKKTS